MDQPKRTNINRTMQDIQFENCVDTLQKETIKQKTWQAPNSLIREFQIDHIAKTHGESIIIPS